jgi:hypothetical protein
MMPLLVPLARLAAKRAGVLGDPNLAAASLELRERVPMATATESRLTVATDHGIVMAMSEAADLLRSDHRTVPAAERTQGGRTDRPGFGR